MATEFIGVRVEGLNRLVRTLKQAGADMTDLKASNRAAAEMVLAAALPLTPVDDTDGGQLKATGRASGTPREAIIRFGYKAVPYAGVTHYGTPASYSDSKGRPRVQSEQPWLAEAAKQTEPQWVELYWAALMKTVDSVAQNYSGD